VKGIPVRGASVEHFAADALRFREVS